MNTGPPPSQFALFCAHLAELQRSHKEATAENKTFAAGAPSDDFMPLGGELVLNLLRVAKRGEDFASALDPANNRSGYLDRMEEAIASYRSILEPPQMVGASCLVRRSGPAFEKKVAGAFIKGAHAVFISRSHLVDSRLQSILNSGQRFTDIVNTANSIFKTLSNITVKGNDNIREKARVTLQSASGEVERFVSNYFDELFGIVPSEDGEFASNGLKLEALRRIRIVEDGLQAAKQKHNDPQQQQGQQQGHGMVNNTQASISRVKKLVKMQASLQEIMNTAMSKCRPHINSNLKAVQCIEKFVNDGFGSFKSRMKVLETSADAFKLRDEISKLSEEVALRHSELTGQLVEGLSRWEELSKLCVLRPVAVYQDDLPPPVVVNHSIVDMDPIKSTGKSIGNMGVKGVSLVKEGAINIKEGALNVGSKALNVGNKAIEFLGLKDDDEPASQPSSTAKPANRPTPVRTQSQGPRTTQQPSKGAAKKLDFDNM